MAPQQSKELWRPDYVRNSVADFTVGFLLARGVSGIILDLDNTFCAGNTGFAVPAAHSAWLIDVKTAKIPVVILSNTGRYARLERIKRLRIKLQNKRMRVAEFGRVYGIPTIAGHKPDEASFLEAAARLGLADRRGTILVIGDQLRTDIWGGNNAGMRTGLVRPISRHEFIGTMLSRLFVDWPRLVRLGIHWPVPTDNPYDRDRFDDAIRSLVDSA